MRVAGDRGQETGDRSQTDSYREPVNLLAVLPHPCPLPLGEGATQPALVDKRTLRLVGTAANILPLPAGEGKGEGETVRCPSPSRFHRDSSVPCLLSPNS